METITVYLVSTQENVPNEFLATAGGTQSILSRFAFQEIGGSTSPRPEIAFHLASARAADKIDILWRNIELLGCRETASDTM
jgi:hypothetical protein